MKNFKNQSVLFLAFACFLAACGTNDAPTLDAPANDSLVQSHLDSAATKTLNGAEAPHIEKNKSFSNVLSNLYRKDSSHVYGAGDCYGAVTSFTSDFKVIGFDSIVCGEYGYHFTQYEMTLDGELSSVRTIDWDMELTNIANGPLYIMKDRKVEFPEGKIVSMVRVDTLKEHFLTSNVFAPEVEKPYQKDVNNQTLTQAQYLEQYRAIWKETLED